MSTTSIISKLKDIRDTNLVDVFVPSLGTFSKFKQLSLKQQKDLIKTGLEGALAGIYIDNVINSIVIENSTFDHNYLITDKISIILKLRTNALGHLCKIDDTNVDIKTIVDKCLTFDIPTTKKLDFNNLIQVNLAVPSIDKDIATNNSQISDLTANKDLRVSDAMGSLYVYEIVKFIDSVKIGDDELSFNDIQVKDMVKVVESLPATINNDIVKFIQDFRSKENDYLTIDSKSITIDARFFTVES